MASSIAGLSKAVEIADMFKQYYSQTFVVSNSDKKAFDEFNALHETRHQLDKSLPLFDISTIETCINMLKLNKAAGGDGLTAEHVIHSHPAIVTHLKTLFSMILNIAMYLKTLVTVL